MFGRMAFSVGLLALTTWAGTANATLLRQISPIPTVYTADTDYTQEDNNVGLGSATGLLEAVDLILPPSGFSTSGCESSDFISFTAGNIALLQRGACTFELKVQNALNAGAIGALIFNEGQVGRTDTIAWSCSGGCTIPSLFLSFSLGNSLAAQLSTSQVQIEMNVTPIPTVPEPTTLTLMGLGLAGLGYRLKKSSRG